MLELRPLTKQVEFLSRRRLVHGLLLDESGNCSEGAGFPVCPQGLCMLSACILAFLKHTPPVNSTFTSFMEISNLGPD